MFVENVLTCAGLILKELKFLVEIHKMLPKMKHMLILFIRLKAKTVTAHQCCLSHTKTTKFCRYNTDSNYYMIDNVITRTQ